MNLDGTDYYYRKNMLGDICAVYNGAGEMLCRYVYDAWGNHRLYDKDGNQIDDDGTSIGSKNPFRYRGYYWDREFGLYYLQSRYYDPTIGRFISPDGIEYLDPASISGMNLYAYCGDNPVMYADPNGQIPIFFIWTVGLLVGSTFGGGIAGMIDAAMKDENIWDGLKNGAALGAMAGISLCLIYTGVSTPMAGGLLGSILVGGGVGSLYGLYDTIKDQSTSGGIAHIDLNRAIKSWGIGMAVGAAAGGFGYAFGLLGSDYGQVLGNVLSDRTFLGIRISRVFSSAFLQKSLMFLGKSLGGFIGGNMVNYLATDSEWQDSGIPLWIITIIKFFWGKS